MSQTIVYLAWFVFLGLLTFLFNNYLEKQNNPNQNIAVEFDDKNIAEVRLRQNRHGHYVVTGKINHKPVTFILDTGATLVSIPSSIAQQLQLEKGYPSQSRTANGTITVYNTHLNSVSIGAIELQNLRATINPHMQGDEILLGMNFMKHLEMTQKGNTMVLRY